MNVLNRAGRPDRRGAQAVPRGHPPPRLPPPGRPAQLTAARGAPDVDARLYRVLVDGGDLLRSELRLAGGGEVLLQLRDAAGADQRRGDPLIAQHPRDRHLCDGLAARGGDLAEVADVGEGLVAELVTGQGVVPGGPRPPRDTTEVLARQHPL